ncbi:glycosyltransferase [Sphingobacterium sp. DK4209]|uniref:Glycosyltransferase n=1 Tax=Sphingobacterium zhuxiongii TaxID=2662364 RepID=A0A5Q0Q7B4_9SPHI|nr:MULTISPECIES: glycosyltransferase [unclassified Sphingobacterium]MVZ64905.1 glycosyltransferase [Sphingobacterium sp. DK4209]QGA25246.1 glycosyltransferase [Sphingobacterium sp. dk4302]
MGIELNIPQIISYFPFGILALLLLFQLYYILFVYSKLAKYRIKDRQDMTAYPPVSLIICAHNEQENLKQFLPSILEQDYPDFEVIIVDDCSSDESKWILKDLCEKYAHLRVVEIKEHIQLKHSKKFALTMGIKSAKHEILVMCDADCQPNSPNWIKEMASAFENEKEIVLGYSPYFKYPGFLNKLIRFETTHTAMSYLSYALKKDAYMGVGRNLAYKKSLFFKGKGFNAHMHIKSGDDDLFINQNATKTNVDIAIHPDAHVYSEPKLTWKSYYKQKARHAGASVMYKGRHKRMLATQLITALLFYCSVFLCLALIPGLWYISLGAYLLRLITQIIVFRPIYRKLGVSDLIFWLPILDLYYYFYICFNGLFNRSKKQVSWK